MNDCVFCRIVAGQIPSTRVYEDDDVLAFMDIGQVNPGHVLVAVKRHAENLYALDEAQAAAKLKEPDDKVAEAHARFRLGQHLLRVGQADEARAQIAEATQLHPDSWAMWRQAADKDARGLASGPAFWTRVDALGSKPYYPRPDIA